MLWKVIIVAWIAYAGQTPKFLHMEHSKRFLSEKACAAHVTAEGLRIEGMLEHIAAEADGEMLHHVTVCVEDSGGQPT